MLHDSGKLEEAEERVRQLLFITGAESASQLPPVVESAAGQVEVEDRDVCPEPGGDRLHPEGEVAGALDQVLHEEVVGPFLELAQDMLKHKHRRRPVLENGKLVGQITCRQLLNAVKGFPKFRR